MTSACMFRFDCALSNFLTVVRSSVTWSYCSQRTQINIDFRDILCGCFTSCRTNGWRYHDSCIKIKMLCKSLRQQNACQTHCCFTAHEAMTLAVCTHIIWLKNTQRQMFFDTECYQSCHSCILQAGNQIVTNFCYQNTSKNHDECGTTITHNVFKSSLSNKL